MSDHRPTTTASAAARRHVYNTIAAWLGGWGLVALVGWGTMTAANPVTFLTAVAIVIIAILGILFGAWGFMSSYEARTAFEQDYPRASTEREALRPLSCQLHDGVRDCCSLDRREGDVSDVLHTELTDRFAAVIGDDK